MATIRAARLGGPVAVTPALAAQTVATVPAGVKWKVSSIRIVNSSAAAVAVLYGIGGVAAGTLVGEVSVPPVGHVLDTADVVMNAGERFQVLASANNVITVSVHGFVLTP